MDVTQVPDGWSDRVKARRGIRVGGGAPALAVWQLGIARRARTTAGFGNRAAARVSAVRSNKEMELAGRGTAFWRAAQGVAAAAAVAPAAAGSSFPDR